MYLVAALHLALDAREVSSYAQDQLASPTQCIGVFASNAPSLGYDSPLGVYFSMAAILVSIVLLAINARTLNLNSFQPTC